MKKYWKAVERWRRLSPALLSADVHGRDRAMLSTRSRLAHVFNEGCAASGAQPARRQSLIARARSWRPWLAFRGEGTHMGIRGDEKWHKILGRGCSLWQRSTPTNPQYQACNVPHRRHNEGADEHSVRHGTRAHRQTWNGCSRLEALYKYRLQGEGEAHERVGSP
jgi:hypothetical protein